jgi:hypothetical protein
MKNTLFLLVFLHAFAFGQTDSCQNLTFDVAVLHYWTHLEDTDITLTDENGRIVFLGCTNASGQAFADNIPFTSGKHYTVTATTEGFREYRELLTLPATKDHYHRYVIDVPMRPVAPTDKERGDLQFDLTVRVADLIDKTKKKRDVAVTVSDEKGIVFEGCTDANGEVYVDSTLILPDKSYVVRIRVDGMHEDRNGSKFTTVGLEYSQNFVIDISPLRFSECWYFPCYEPSEPNRAADHAFMVNDINAMKIAFWEEYEIPVTKLAVWIHYETWDEEERLMREARLLLAHLKKHLPGMEFDDEIGIEYHPGHRHNACIRVVRLG